MKIRGFRRRVRGGEFQIFHGVDHLVRFGRLIDSRLKLGYLAQLIRHFVLKCSIHDLSAPERQHHACDADAWECGDQ
jgi:hypothetical protein